MTKIINTRIVSGGMITDGLTVRFENGKIVSLDDDYTADADECIDGRFCYLAPGFIDLHSHGGGGSDFLDCTEEAFFNAARLHISHGTTSILPTTVASTQEETFDIIDTYKKVKSSEYGSFFAGLHLEGPYFSPVQGGAQDKKQLRTPSPEEYMPVLDACGDIKRWSVAPELPGALELGRELKRRGILAAAAHSNATYSEMLDAIEAGYSHITHLYSCTSTVTRKNGWRSGGIIETAFLRDDLTVEIIADGCHLPAELLKLVYKIKGPSRIALVTDSMRGAGMPDGPSVIGSRKNGNPCIIEDSVAKLPDRSAFAGSVATSDRLVRTMIKLAGVSLPDAVTMMTSTPAAIQHLAGKGSILPGYDADFVMFDDDINVIRTIIGGRTFFDRNRNI